MNETVNRRRFLHMTAAGAAAALARGTRPSPAAGGEKAEPLRIYIALDDHTDYMWSADEKTYRKAFVEMIDYYLDQADRTANEPPAHQGRFCCDGSYWLWCYERARPAEACRRLARRIRDGHINVPLTPLVACYGAAPAEAVLRSMAYAGQIERRWKLRLPLARVVEPQTLPFGLGGLFAGAGAKYCWHGICSCATRVPNGARLKRQHEIYWWTGRDGSRLLTKWYSMWGGNASLGGYAEARKPDQAIEFVSRNKAFAKRHPFRAVGLFGKGWDDLKTLTDEFVTVAKTKTRPDRKVIVSNEVDFFRDFERSYGRDLPAFGAAFGNEWELLTASMAEVSASVRRATEKLRAAEALAAVVALKRPPFLRGREKARDAAFMNLGLYYEHDWCANGRVARRDRATWQRRIAAGVTGYVDRLHDDAVAALAGMIRKGGSGDRFFVFNPLGWRRTDAADVAFDAPGKVHVVDLATGKQVPSQRVTLAGKGYLRILAADLPPVGYKVYEVRRGAGQAFDTPIRAGDGVLESPAVHLTLAGRGAVTSLVQKTRDRRELLRAFRGRAVNDLGPGAGKVEVDNAGCVSATLCATAETPLRHVTRVTLTRGLPRIDIRNEITQSFAKPAAWAFGFNLTDPDVWHEEVGAVIRARLLDDGGHYSPINARYDWLTLNHFADMTGRQGGVTLSSADCAFMKLGQSTHAKLDTATPQINVLAGGQVDGPKLGIPNQGGDSHFLQRFALLPHGPKLDEAAAMRFALAHQNPPVAAFLTGTGRELPEKTFSLLSVDAPDVLLWALKVADDGLDAGLVARLWSFAPRGRRVRLALADGKIARAVRTTHVETPLAAATVRDGALATTLPPHAMRTFALVPGR